MTSPAAVPPATPEQAPKSPPGPETLSPGPGQPAGKPKGRAEERDLPGLHPVCQRPRLKRMQQFEDLEDEIPQFV